MDKREKRPFEEIYDEYYDKAVFFAGSDHKERLRKQLFNKGGVSMKLIDELKGKLENASEEEAKKILEETKKDVEEAGVILDDAELDQAAGGGVRQWLGKFF